NPDAVRPWQHVLNPLSGYLTLAQSLCDSAEFAEGWNFGPSEQDARPVRFILERLRERWPTPFSWQADERPNPSEARFLMLDSGKARARLGWSPVWDLEAAIDKVVQWHDAHRRGADMRRVSIEQIENFMQHQLPLRSVGHSPPDPAAWVDPNDSPPEDLSA
ncbi:MAG TPA: hypothetical protein VGF15_04525, partial [Solirubrobacteraceae bacterium]